MLFFLIKEIKLHLNSKVHVAWSVDYIDVVVAPERVGGRRLDGDAALPLQLHAVHGGTDAILALHLVNSVYPAGVEEDALGEGGLAGVNVGGYSNVSHQLDLVIIVGCLVAHTVPS